MKSIPTPHRVLAFDPGYERLGVAVLEKDDLLFSDCIRTSAKLEFPERLRQLGEAVEKLLKKWKPDAVALENIYFEKNVKTAIGVAQVRGVLAYLAAAHGLVVYEYTPLQVKAAITGNGHCDKRAIAAMIPRLIKLTKAVRLDDELDAIAVGITCLASLR